MAITSKALAAASTGKKSSATSSEAGLKPRHLLVEVELQVWMNFVDRLVDLLQLRGVHVRADAAVSETDFLVSDPSAKVNPHLQLGFFVT